MNGCFRAEFLEIFNPVAAIPMIIKQLPQMLLALSEIGLVDIPDFTNNGGSVRPPEQRLRPPENERFRPFDIDLDQVDMRDATILKKLIERDRSNLFLMLLQIDAGKI